MTTAFELGCLSAMEKVAVNSGPAGPSGRPKVKLGPNPNDILTSNPDTKAYDAPYWNSFGTRAHNNLVGGLASIGDAAIGAGNFIGNAASTGYDYATAPGRALGDTLGSLMYSDKSPPPTKAPKPLPYGIKDEAPRPYGPAGQSNKNSDLISPAFTEKDLAASRLALVKRQIAIHDAAMKQRIEGTPVLRPSEQHLAGPGLDSETAAKAAPESTSESTPEPTSEPQAQGGLASYLKNPYVLGGLGIGALGLGGYGLYNHFNSKKKKKKKSDSE